ASGRSKCHRSSRRRLAARVSLPASPSARGRTPTSWPHGSRHGRWTPKGRSIASDGERGAGAPRHGFRNSRHSTSDMARLEVIRSWLQTPAPVAFDTDYAAFAESLELAMVELYNDSLLKLTGQNVATAARFRDHHRAHAQAYASLAVGKAKGVPNNTLV